MFAKSYDELKPLVDHIKNGRLRDIERWIADGKPLDLKEQPTKGPRKKPPLQYAIDIGFYTVVEILLEAKVPVDGDPRSSPMATALAKRRFDIVKLLCEHGYDPKSVDLRDVFATWDPEIMEFFIERGADPEAGMPLAWALINRTRTATSILKKYKDRFATFQEQANIALRHHCKLGNRKWVSLMLWAGADPFVPGDDLPNAKSYPNENGLTAVGFALLHGKFDIVSMKQIKIPSSGPVLDDLFYFGCHGDGLDLLIHLVRSGINPNIDGNGGCPAIQRLLEKFEGAIGFSYLLHRLGPEDSKNGNDNDLGRDYLRTIHALAKYGAKWRPKDSKEIGRARRGLLRMITDYTVEFVWIMAKYSAAELNDVETLLATPAMQQHVTKRRLRLVEIINEWRIEIRAPIGDGAQPSPELTSKKEK